MQIKTIEKVISNKMNEWLKTITDEDLRKETKNNLLVSGGSIASMLMGADAPNDKELRKMCYSVGLIGIEEMPIEHLATRLLEYCKRHKLNLSDYDF